MPGLHFVEQKEQVALIAKFSQTEQVFSSCYRDPALALDGFDQNRGGRFRNRCSHRFEIVKRDMAKSRHHRLEAFLHFFLTRRRDPGQRPSVE